MVCYLEASFYFNLHSADHVMSTFEEVTFDTFKTISSPLSLKLASASAEAYENKQIHLYFYYHLCLQLIVEKNMIKTLQCILQRKVFNALMHKF